MRELATTLLHRGMALLVLFTLSIFLISVALIIYGFAGSPIVVNDEMLGTNGGLLRIYRFRSSGAGGPVFRAFGRFLRLSGIDEWPAFWNVILGDISLAYLFSRLKQPRR